MCVDYLVKHSRWIIAKFSRIVAVMANHRKASCGFWLCHVVRKLHATCDWNMIDPTTPQNWNRIKFKTVFHHSDVIMGAMASQITNFTIAYSTVYSGADQRKYQSSASLAFVRGIHRWPVNSPHKWPVMRKMFPLNNVIIFFTSRLVKFPELLMEAVCLEIKQC